MTNKNKKFYEWLAGLIDGDGCFLLSQKGYGSLEVTVDIRDSYCLYIIKNEYGGSIKLRSGSNSVRYRLHHKEGLLRLLNNLNGLIRNSYRLLQYNKLCFKYDIFVLPTVDLVFNSSWMSGFFDADGSISINSSNKQLSITISQKTQELLLLIKNLYGGHIYMDRSSNTFIWYITKKETILFLLENYFKKNYVYTKKKNRLFLIEEYYFLMDLKKENNILFEKMWDNFFFKWKQYTTDKDMYHFNEN